MVVAVITLAVGVPEENVIGKQDDTCCNRDVEGLRKKWFENKKAQDVTEPTECLRKMFFEIKMAR